MFYPSSHERNIDFVLDIFDNKGNILTYEQFITLKEFPIPFREFISVIKAVPSGLLHERKLILVLVMITKFIQNSDWKAWAYLRELVVINIYKTNSSFTKPTYTKRKVFLEHAYS